MQLSNCDIYHLKEIAQRKKLICFGAGKEFREFLSDFEDLHLEDNIYAIADNNAEKIGKTILVAGIVVPIISVGQLLDVKDAVLFISCADISGVLEQLEKYNELETTQCFAARFVRSCTNKTEESKRQYPVSFRITQEPLIPPKIHYCWFGGAAIPDRNLAWIDSWKKYCPDYEIICWNESNYDVSKNRYMYEAYKNRQWGFVSDYARIDIVYNQGGIYLDTDVELIKSWEDLRHQYAFMGIEANLRINLGLGFGSVQYFPLWKELLDMYDNIYFENEDGTWNLIPCPELQNEVYVHNGFVNNGNYQKVGGASVYPAAVLSPKDLYTGEIRIAPHTFSIHHYDGSWLDDTQLSKDNLRKMLFEKFKNVDGEV